MSAKALDSKPIVHLLKANKIATLDELKRALRTRSTMTVFRKLTSIGYLSSYSHRGKYYTIPKIAKFDQTGLWSWHSIWFSKFGNLVETAKEFVDSSMAGFTVKELEQTLHVEAQHTLLKLFQAKRIYRKKISGLYVYVAFDPTKRKSQIAMRKSSASQFEFDLSYELKALSEELKAAIILFFSLLNEKQRRLYAGLEAFKLGYGGDKKIAQLLGLDVHTVAKGRQDLFTGQIEEQRIRQEGAGRKPVEKKIRKSSKRSKNY
ncbi:MAG: hypothetical protein C4B58_07430 [Deltaproteobacteria bacterium]|nr:MAG: hypothetical protein C4B58_07430 [Deltaproteobacteria bacterium]